MFPLRTKLIASAEPVQNQQLLLRTFLVSSKSLDIGSLLGMTCRWCQPFPLINKLLRTSLGRRRDAAHQPISEVLGLKLAETRGGCLLQGPSLVLWLLAACPACAPLRAASPALMCHPPHTLVAGFCCKTLKSFQSKQSKKADTVLQRRVL